MNTQALTKPEQEMPVVPADVSPMDLQAALGGDLSRLSGEGRLKYYGALCKFVGLNPLSKPFDWLTLNGKLVLYANKGCAEQLRMIHHVSVEVIERRFENGCHIVRVKARDSKGREDESIGAVAIAQNATGDVMANALMKAETKAKRRVSLSICGLGMLDESELETVRNARPANVSDITDTATASDRAAALNAEISQTVEAEVVTSAPVETGSPAATPTPTTAAPLPQAAATPQPEARPVPQQSATSATATTAGPALKSSQTLPDETVRKLENILASKGGDWQQTCIAYLRTRGLKQGCDIGTLSAQAATFITGNADRFHKRVEEWVAAGNQAQ